MFYILQQNQWNYALPNKTHGRTSWSRWTAVNLHREPRVKAEGEQFHVKLLTKSLLHSTKGTSRLLPESPKAINTSLPLVELRLSLALFQTGTPTCPGLKPFTGQQIQRNWLYQTGRVFFLFNFNSIIVGASITVPFMSYNYLRGNALLYLVINIQVHSRNETSHDQ